MPRRNNPHPSLRKQTYDPQPLQHGDEHPGDAYDPDMDDHEDGEEEQHAPAKDPTAERFERMERELELMRRENDDLRRRNPVEPVVRTPAEVEDETDWDELIFKDPKAAVKLIKEQARKEITTELKREYTQEQGTNQFWTDFYNDHPDLKEEDDLVQTMLNSNLSKLGGMPVKKAMDELADLTRKRIMRYSNNRGGRSRAFAEGNSPPRPGRPAETGEKVVTLTDIIRNRKSNRRKAASAA